MKQKKIFLGGIVIILLFLFLIGAVKSDGTDTGPLGYIKLQEALLKHPNAKSSFAELQKFKSEREKDIQLKIQGKKLSDKEKEQINALAQKYEQEIQEKDNQLTKVLFADIQAAIKEVAASKGLAVVVDAQAILYGGVDITQDVIDKLNSGTKSNTPNKKNKTNNKPKKQKTK